MHIPNQVESFDGEINNNDIIIFVCVALDMIGGQTQQGPPLSRRTLYIHIHSNVLVLLRIHTKVHHSPYPIQNRTDPTNEFGQIFVLVVTIATRQLHSVWMAWRQWVAGLLVDDVVSPNIMKGLLFCVTQALLDI